MATISPTAFPFRLNALSPRAWQGGPSDNCWTMRYDPSNARWVLIGGNGLVVYHKTSSWDCNGANVFDELIFDATLQAPSSITVWPFSPSPCACAMNATPPPLSLPFTLYPPYVHGSLVRARPLTLRLTPLLPSRFRRASVCRDGLFLTLLPPDVRGHVVAAPEDLVLTLLSPRVHANVAPPSLDLVFSLASPRIGGQPIPSPLDLIFTLEGPAVSSRIRPAPLDLVLTLANLALARAVLPAPLDLVLTLASPSISRAILPAPLDLFLTLASASVHCHLGTVPLDLFLTLASPDRTARIHPSPMDLICTLASPFVHGSHGPAPLDLILTLATPSFAMHIEPFHLELFLNLDDPAIGFDLGADGLDLILDLSPPTVHGRIKPATLDLILTLEPPQVYHPCTDGVVTDCCPCVPTNLIAELGVTSGSCSCFGVASFPLTSGGTSSWIGNSGTVEGALCGGNASFALYCIDGVWKGDLILYDSTEANCFTLNGVTPTGSVSCDPFHVDFEFAIGSSCGCADPGTTIGVSVIPA